MSKVHRVFNVSRNCRIKYSQALHAVEACACAWVDSETIRDLSLKESLAARNKQSAERIPLPFAEIPGLIFKPPTTAHISMRERGELVSKANKLAKEEL
jgi:hypothetical protein